MWLVGSFFRSTKDLTKFGYRPDMQVIFFKNPFIFWLLAGTCCKSIVNLFSILLQSSELGPLFEFFWIDFNRIKIKSPNFYNLANTVLFSCGSKFNSYFSGQKNEKIDSPKKHGLES
jgi:hypothetical protein